MKIIDIPQATLDLLAFCTDGAEPWPEPEALSIHMLSVPQFKPELLPEILRNYVLDESHRMQGPPDFVAVASLVALGSIIGTGCAVRPKQQDDWHEYPNLWGAIIGGPSTKKSPSINAGCRPINYLEADAQNKHNVEQAAYVSEKEARDYELKALKTPSERKKSSLSDEEVLSRIRELSRRSQEEPKLQRYRSNDVTVEKLGELLRKH